MTRPVQAVLTVIAFVVGFFVLSAVVWALVT